MMLGNEFYLTHRYDKRGRCYAQGYHVNPQGNDWNKAVIELAEKEVVTIFQEEPEQERSAA
jgi:DNA-directed RNA polymerase